MTQRVIITSKSIPYLPSPQFEACTYGLEASNYIVVRWLLVIYCIPCLVLHVCIHVTYFLLSNGFPSSCLRYLTNNCVQSCTLPIIYKEELLHKQQVWADMQQLTHICNKILKDVPLNIVRSCLIISERRQIKILWKKIGFNELCHNVGTSSYILMQHFYINNQMTLNLKDDNNRFSTCAIVNG